MAAGHRWCVELDLESSLIESTHDVLMAYVVRQIEHKRVLRLIHRYLEVGTMSGGLVSRRQGGHRFVRYADDVNIYVRSRRAGLQDGNRL